MAEAIALTIPGLLSQAIETFGYIQLARNFGDDFERFQLRLDIQQRRLVKWGIATDLFPPDEKRTSRFDDALDEQLIEDTISGLLRDFRRSANLSARYQKKQASARDPNALAVFNPEKDMNELPRKGHRKLLEICTRVMPKPPLTKRLYWAIYEREHLSELVDSIQRGIDDLYSLVPQLPAKAIIEKNMAELVASDVTDLEGVGCLTVVASAAGGIDEELVKASRARAQTSGHDVRDITIGEFAESSNFYVGDRTSGDMLQVGFKSPTGRSHSVRNINIKGKSSGFRVGDEYGY